MQYTATYSSPLGGITLASNGEQLTGLWFDGQKYFGSTLGPQHEARDLPVFHEAARWLDLYFSGWIPGPPKRWAAQWATTPFPSSFPATGWWAARGI